jgi:hypothetical protein
MKFGKLVKGLGAAAATVGATAINPALGAVVGSFVGGSVGKEAGKRVQQKTGRPAARVAAPVGAVAVPTAFAAAGVDLTGICGVGQQVLDLICASPEAGGVAVGLGAVLAHTLGKGAVTTVRKPSQQKGQ